MAITAHTHTHTVSTPGSCRSMRGRSSGSTAGGGEADCYTHTNSSSSPKTARSSGRGGSGGRRVTPTAPFSAPTAQQRSTSKSRMAQLRGEATTSAIASAAAAAASGALHRGSSGFSTVSNSASGDLSSAACTYRESGAEDSGYASSAPDGDAAGASTGAAAAAAASSNDGFEGPNEESDVLREHYLLQRALVPLYADRALHELALLTALALATATAAAAAGSSSNRIAVAAAALHSRCVPATPCLSYGGKHLLLQQQKQKQKQKQLSISSVAASSNDKSSTVIDTGINTLLALQCHLGQPDNAHLLPRLAARAAAVLTSSCTPAAAPLLKLLCEALFDGGSYGGSSSEDFSCSTDGSTSLQQQQQQQQQLSASQQCLRIGEGRFGAVVAVRAPLPLSAAAAAAAAAPPQQQHAQQQAQQELAIKRIPRERTPFEAGSTAVDVYTEVAALQACADVQGVCKLHEFGLEARHYCLVMERCSVTLREWRGCRAAAPSVHDAALYLRVYAQVRLTDLYYRYCLLQ
jgi:hypothetical protein